MKKTPALRLINPQSHCSFVIKEEPFDLNTKWHYHPEIEIMYFRKGKVSAIMGNRFMEFNEGELVLLGQDFPHVIFKHENHKEGDTMPEGVVIQFAHDFLGAHFFQAPEMVKVRSLLWKAKSGILFKTKETGKVKRFLEGISRKSGPYQLTSLLEILIHLSEEQPMHFLTIEHEYNRSELDERRMRLIKEYIYANFKNKITVADMANLVNMTETSFCRYYKRRTLKSLTRTLNEIRVSYACEMLRKKEANVTEACYQSGFTSPAFFSRTFKKIVGMPPSDYRKHKMEQIVRW
ncbi:AraC family transcriptional regulator [Ulvibacterium sp.]|uniref:AraC family transcriptional regulator n=1 Tax=Ulvibacterium sp. TaxID=2665914 RepID=UPI003BACA74F